MGVGQPPLSRRTTTLPTRTNPARTPAENKVSVSQNGPALMGFASIWQNLALFFVFLVSRMCGWPGWLGGLY